MDKDSCHHHHSHTGEVVLQADAQNGPFVADDGVTLYEQPEFTKI
jgi:hypothetical protein